MQAHQKQRGDQGNVIRRSVHDDDAGQYVMRNPTAFDDAARSSAGLGWHIYRKLEYSFYAVICGIFWAHAWKGGACQWRVYDASKFSTPTSFIC